MVVDCDAVGRYLPHPTDRCAYLRCVYGPEPWYDQYGNLGFYARPFACPAGTAVKQSRYPQPGAYTYSPAYGPHHKPCEPVDKPSCTGNPSLPYRPIEYQGRDRSRGGGGGGVWDQSSVGPIVQDSGTNSPG